MNYLKHPQCRFCAEMNRYADCNQRDRSFYQLKPYTGYSDPPLLYCYDMTQRPVQDNYMTYCNVVNNFAGDNEPQYVQVIDSGSSHGRLQFCVTQKNDSAMPSNPNNAQIKLFRDKKENNCGVVLCTCNDFLNSNLQNRNIYETLPGRDIERREISIPISLVPRANVTRNSIESYEKSIEDQRDNSIYSNGSILSEPMCRFCHLSKNTQADQLISPCYCCGSLKYVHQNCLKTWLEVSKKQRENNGNKPPHCELCNFKYVRKRKFQFGKIRQPKLSHNDCALHLIFLCSLLVMVTSASVTILCFAMEKSGSKGNRMQYYDKTSDGSLKFTDRKFQSDKSGNILCEYLSNLNLKDYSQSQRQSASKLSVLCDFMMNGKDRKPNKIAPADQTDLLLLSEASLALPKWITTSTSVLLKESVKRLYTKENDVKRRGEKVGNGRGEEERVKEERGKGGDERGRGRVGGGGGGGVKLWILSPEEAVTLASGVIFFIAFFIAMMVQVKSSYTCYQLVMQWVRLNYTNEVQSLQLTRKSTVDLELKNIRLASITSKSASTAPREYIERCVTEI